MKSAYLFVFGLTTILGVSAQSGLPRQICPKFTPMKNFDVSKYVGKWYEIRRLPNPYERFQTCIATDFSLVDRNRIDIVNYGSIKFFGVNVPIKAKGTAFIRDLTKKSELSVKYYAEAYTTEPNYLILDTDYENYSLVYSCWVCSMNIKREYAWILSREKLLDVNTLERLEHHLKSQGVPLENMITVDQSCMDNRLPKLINY